MISELELSEQNDVVFSDDVDASGTILGDIVSGDDQHPDASHSEDDGDLEREFDPPPDKQHVDQAPFRILGHNDDNYYYFPKHKKQVVALSASGHSMNNLYQLAPFSYWSNRYKDSDITKKPSPSVILSKAADDLITRSISKGVFQIEEAMRGTGIWKDQDRIIINCGHKIFVNTQEYPFDGFESDYTYTASVQRLEPYQNPLDNYEANRLLILCKSLCWKDPIAGYLLAGWIVIAPICAALDYRPHLYITGESDSGKSTIMDAIIKPALGRIAFCVDGGTTEPSIRQFMGFDGRPIIFDEAEGESGKNNMVSVLELARKSSSGATIRKFGQRPFKAQSSYCFSAINPPVNKTADENRISFLELKKNRTDTAVQDFADILAMISETITEDFSDRLITRTVTNIDALMQNIQIFRVACRKILKDARTSKQIGTLIAGAWSLGRLGVVTMEEAEEFINKKDWKNITPINNDGDPVRLIQFICSHVVKFGQKEETLGNLIGILIKQEDSEADAILRRYCIKVTKSGVSIGDNGPNMSRMLKGTDWEKRWNRTLSDIAGSVKVSKDYFTTAVQMNAVRLPLGLFNAEKGEDNEDANQG